MFMTDFFNNFQSSVTFSNSEYKGDLKKIMSQKGILHMYGHGDLVVNKEAGSVGFEFSYYNKGKLKTERQLTGKFDVNRDLVILNNCFSGHPNFIINEFNRTIPLRIMNNGAKAVISSPSKVDDFSSAAFFNLFYQNIEKGMLYEDAFFEAKKTFFKQHPELRQPQYWNAFQLIQSYKLKNEISTSQDSKWLLFSVFCLLDMFLFLAYFSMQKRALIRH
jgi:CHAT domain-containing protein